VQLYGKVSATNQLGNGGKVTIFVKSGSGYVIFHDEIFASNVSVNTDKGGVKFMKHITLSMIDPNAVFENEADRGKIPAASSTAIQDGEIYVRINGDGDIIFDNAASLGGITRYTKYLHGQDGSLTASNNYYASNNVNRFILSTNGNIKLQTNVDVRANGQFDISSKLLEHAYITANNASIAIRLSGAEFDQLDPMSGGLKFFVSSANLVLDDKISFINATNATFSTPGNMYVLQNVTVDNLSLTFHELHFVHPACNYQQCNISKGSLNVHNGGKLILASNQSFNYDDNLLKYIYNTSNVNLTLKSLDSLTIATAINVAGGRSLNLTAKSIVVTADITSQDGHVTLRYVNRDGKSTSVFDQNTANHMKLTGNNTFAVFASNNLLINGQVNNLNIADFAVEGAGTLTINAELTARQHLGFRSFGSIYINKQVRTLPGGEAVEYILPNKDKNLHYGIVPPR
ncbi:MAG: hypothetical protein ORN98_04790, partial [Alphaproteobacteria bacterium]|nr:hypothetical protein [Alphaproteobacteria bacterium]